MSTHVNGVEVSLDNGILRVIINRAERMNAVTTESLEAIADTFEKYAGDSSVQAGILSGSGRAFCTGADLSTMPEFAEGQAVTLDAANRCVDAIRLFPRPVVAAVNGPALGVGVSLALACDLTVATESSYFLLSFTKVGLMPDGGTTALVAASIGRARAMKMALLAERLTARDALESGLICAVYPDEDFVNGVRTLARRVASGPSEALHATKSAINDATLTELSSALTREKRWQLELLATADYTEGVAAFLEKRAAVFATS